jgi:hypothetical protein
MMIAAAMDAVQMIAFLFTSLFFCLRPRTGACFFMFINPFCWIMDKPILPQWEDYTKHLLPSREFPVEFLALLTGMGFNNEGRIIEGVDLYGPGLVK